MSDEESGGNFWDNTLDWLRGNGGTIGKVGGGVLGTVAGAYMGNPAAGATLGAALGGGIAGLAGADQAEQDAAPGVNMPGGPGMMTRGNPAALPPSPYGNTNRFGELLNQPFLTNNDNRVWLPPNAKGQGGDALIQPGTGTAMLLSGGSVDIMDRPAPMGPPGPDSQSWNGQVLERIDQAGNSAAYSVVRLASGMIVVRITIRDPSGRILGRADHGKLNELWRLAK